MTMSFGSSKSSITTVAVTKALAAASAYDANDVISQTASAGEGTSWTFADVARAGSSGYIVGAIAQSESEGVTPRLTLYLFNAIPTSELDDHAANTAPDAADKAKFLGKIDFEALESLGTTDSFGRPTAASLPLPFKCAAATSSIYGILVTRDAFTQTATDDMTISLIVES